MSKKLCNFRYAIAGRLDCKKVQALFFIVLYVLIMLFYITDKLFLKGQTMKRFSYSLVFGCIGLMQTMNLQSSEFTTLQGQSLIDESRLEYMMHLGARIAVELWEKIHEVGDHSHSKYQDIVEGKVAERVLPEILSLPESCRDDGIAPYECGGELAMLALTSYQASKDNKGASLRVFQQLQAQPELLRLLRSGQSKFLKMVPDDQAADRKPEVIEKVFDADVHYEQNVEWIKEMSWYLVLQGLEYSRLEAKKQPTQLQELLNKRIEQEAIIIAQQHQIARLQGEIQQSCRRQIINSQQCCMIS